MPTDDFESYSKNENILYYARDLKDKLGYKEWRNFEGVIKRAINIINHTHCKGLIQKTTSNVNIGSGANRMIADYLLDNFGLNLVKELSSSQKLNNVYSVRNETIVLQLIEKYCKVKMINFLFQYQFQSYRFDCKVGKNILIEFDEPHHESNTKQKVIDVQKEDVALSNGYKLFRVNLEMDIIDVILYLEKNVEH